MDGSNTELPMYVLNLRSSQCHTIRLYYKRIYLDTCPRCTSRPPSARPCSCRHVAGLAGSSSHVFGIACRRRTRRNRKTSPANHGTRRPLRIKQNGYKYMTESYQRRYKMVLYASLLSSLALSLLTNFVLKQGGFHME